MGASSFKPILNLCDAKPSMRSLTLKNHKEKEKKKERNEIEISSSKRPATKLSATKQSRCNNAINIRIFIIYCNLKFSIEKLLIPHFCHLCESSRVNRPNKQILFMQIVSGGTDFCVNSPVTGIRPVWPESSLCSQWVAKDPSFLHVDSEEWSDWADALVDLSLCWAHRPFCWFCHEVAQITLGESSFAAQTLHILKVFSFTDMLSFQNKN